jgi:ribonuclease R
LGGEYFRFDEMRQELRGERTGTRYSIGTRVRIQVSRVDLDGRKIDFRLVHEGQPALAGKNLSEKAINRSSKIRPALKDRVDEDAGLTGSYDKSLSRDRLARKTGKPAKAGAKAAAPKKSSVRKRR